MAQCGRRHGACASSLAMIEEWSEKHEALAGKLHTTSCASNDALRHHDKTGRWPDELMLARSHNAVPATLTTSYSRDRHRDAETTCAR